ncbi:SDR family oxidoreductase [Pseudomonas entomophila]|uniref:type I polyketide synthase n=1 Tax=Pseudomonas entomophila TaxID=312306 RepID=UPI0023D811EF|nr:type I polyketide synthase [Pseudomonas entomophila]MDF0732205.1 SDR family oxidoreductase [Pseudomonas entomophila]
MLTSDAFYGTSEPIAVVGLACRFPEAHDSHQFWLNLLAGRECSRRFSRDELLAAGLDPALVDHPDFVNVASTVERPEYFDATLFGYSPQEAESIDPQQRLFLQTVWHALEHAGFAPREVPHKTGVFASGRLSTYPGREAIRVTEVAQVKGLQALMGNDKDYLASRAAYKLNLRGPAITVQTACSSSLVAVHMACESLRSGECAMAVAGGVAVSFPQQAGYRYQPGMIFSPDGRCRPFDADAQGTFAGNGVGAVVLRRLDDALRDNDPILAVLRASAINNDGSHKVGYTAPSVLGQREVIRDALLLADVEAASIGMLEAHGTGTPLGDPIELQALREAFAERSDIGGCALGSVKGNLGHLDTAAGIASLIKTVLAVRHGKIPPCVHFQRPNPALKLEQSPFHVPREALDWPAGPRRAGVSSFGIGGTNCHMIVEALPEPLRPTLATPRADALLLSAASEASLRRLAGAYAERLGSGDAPAHLAHTALHARQLDLPQRLAVPLHEETAHALQAYAQGSDDALLHVGLRHDGQQLWLCSGQGSQWAGMGLDLYGVAPAFTQSLDRAFACAAGHLDPPLREVMFGEHGALIDRMDYAQPAIVAFTVAMAAHWREQGLSPDLLIGHSVGEFAACVIAGHYPLETLLPLVIRRGQLMHQSGADGRMLAVFCTPARLAPLAEAHGVEVAVYNAEEHLVASGAAPAIEALAQALQARQIRCTPLGVAGAAHSRLLEPILDAWQHACASLQAAPGKTPVISTLTGQVLALETLDQADYWRRHLREPVRFHQALQAALDQGIGVALEVGADAPLASIGKRSFPTRCAWVASARRHKASTELQREALLKLFAAGLNLDWRSLLPSRGLRGDAPLYPFDEQRYWCAAAPTQAAPAPTQDLLLQGGRLVIEREAAALDLPRLERLYRCVTELHGLYVDKLVRQCVGDAIDHGVTALQVLRGGRLLPRHRQLLERLLRACAEDGYYRLEHDRYHSAEALPHARHAALLVELRGCCEGLEVIADTVERAGEQLFAMMSGSVEPVAVIFPQSASSGVEVLYQQFSYGRYFNQIAAGVVAGLVRQKQQAGGAPLRILEVGGGTGGTTAWLLPELAEVADVRYCFTDISPLFSRRAQEKFGAFDFVEYQQFDLHKPAAEQGFSDGHYDLIVAANVIHATQHIGDTLGNLRPLLKPGGALLMREITRPMRLFDFVFGPLVLPLHDQAARGGELFLSTAHWQRQCLESGFERVDWLPDDGTPTARISEHILLARTAVAAATTGLVGHDSGSALLGRQLGEHRYQADWRDCQGDSVRWQRRLGELCAALTARHGDTRRPPVFTEAPPLPARLDALGIEWRAGAFGAAQVALSQRDDEGHWRLLAQTGPAHGALPRLQAAPDTHYQWHWRALPGAGSAPLALRVEPPQAREALAAAGIAHHPEAQACLLVVEAAELSEMATQVLDALGRDRQQPLLVVTRGAWPLAASDAVAPEQRALWGLLRVASAEQPNRALAIIDLAQQAPWQALLPGLGAAQAGERWIAVRDGVAQVQALVPHAHAAAALPAASLALPGWHLVTGAFGGLGRLSAAWLAQQGARRIALLAPRRSAQAEQWQAHFAQTCGIEVRWLACDVSEPAALADALDSLRREGGLAGAIHCAARLDDTPLANLDAGRLGPLLQVKCQAARQLQAALQEGGRYLLLYSSAAASLGAPGQGAHALASAYLDGLADTQAHGALRTLSIAWGAWGEVGRAADDGLHAKLAQAGMGTLSTAEGLWHLEQAVVRGAPWHLAMRIEPQRIDPSRKLFAPTPSAAASPHPTAPRMAERLPAPTLTGDPGSDREALHAWLTASIRSQLRLSAEQPLAATQDLMQRGLDSLLFLELSSTIQRELGVRLDAERAYRDLSIQGLASLLLDTAPTATTRHPSDLQPNPAERYEPFPLTPIQHAYWLGRTDLIDYGGVACHVLFEWDKALASFDLARFEQAWNALIARHDMLRMVVDSDGRQRILENTPWYQLPRTDLRGLTPQAREQRLAHIREQMSYRVPPTDRWPLFEVTVSELDDGLCRLHMNLDLLLFDVQSFKVMMDDLARAYAGERLEPLQLTFRDYVMAELAQREGAQWRQAWRFWMDTLDYLPGAPELPMAQAPVNGQPRFHTLQASLDTARWSRLKRQCQDLGITASTALLTLFAHTLESVSRTPDFTLNLTYFNRRPLHPQVQQLIGDFTSVLLVDFQLGRGASLRELMQATQARLWQRLAHTAVNGVELMRELGRRRGQSRQPAMPVVFTSMLGMSLEGQAIDQAMTATLGDPVHVFTQTPQVWLDHQVMEIDGELVFSWYCMRDVLADGVEQRLFDAYRQLLEALADQPQAFDSLPALPRHDWSVHLDGEPLDVQALEASLRQVPGVLGARIDIDRGQCRLLGNLLAAPPRDQSDSPAAVSPLADSDLPGLDASEREEVQQTWAALEQRAREGVIATLREHGLFTAAGQAHDLPQVMARLGALPRFSGLVRRWLALLCDEGLVRRQAQDYVSVRALPEPAHALAPLPAAPWSQTLGDYLRTCIGLHGELFRGERSALGLLFAGDDRVVRAFYSENPVLRCLNRSVTQAALALAEGRRDLRVLEVGAGTGATTAELLPALERHLREYRFTDISKLFLEQARERFAAWPAFSASELDLNRPIDHEQHPGYDLIVAVNVLHDVVNVPRSLRRLHGLLREGGHLLLVEATERDSALQLASIGFIENLSDFEDARADDGKAMLDLPRWREAVQRAGFSWVLNWPRQADDSMRQHFMLARAEAPAHLDLPALAERLGTGKAGWPLRLRLVEQGQAQRIEPAATAATAPPRSAAVAPALLRQVGELWHELLGQPVHEASDFFACGGDSLIATRMIARLNRLGYGGSSLRSLFDHPRLGDFCATLAPANAPQDDNPLALARGPHPQSLFVFHASDGDISAYLPLARGLGLQVFGLQADPGQPAASLEALAQRYVQAVRRQQPQGPYLLLGWSYGSFLAEAAAHLLHGAGEAVRLVLLDPVCRADFQFSQRAELLRLMAQGANPLPLPEDFEQRSEAQQLATFIELAVQAGLLKQAPAPAQAEAWLAHIEHLLRLLAEHRQPRALALPCLWLEAGQRPAHWCAAEQDWAAWATQAQRQRLACGHWQLLLDDQHLPHTCQTIAAWIAATEEVRP